MWPRILPMHTLRLRTRRSRLPVARHPRCGGCVVSRSVSDASQLTTPSVPPSFGTEVAVAAYTASRCGPGQGLREPQGRPALFFRRLLLRVGVEHWTGAAVWVSALDLVSSPVAFSGPPTHPLPLPLPLSLTTPCSPWTEVALTVTPAGCIVLLCAGLGMPLASRKCVSVDVLPVLRHAVPCALLCHRRRRGAGPTRSPALRMRPLRLLQALPRHQGPWGRARRRLPG
jgi:hypothetical protein